MDTPHAPERVERFERVCLFLLVALGLILRSRGVLWGPTIELWGDEASWAIRMYERPLADHVIRPPAFVVLTRLCVALLGNTELGFRLLPWCAGIATPVVGIFLARRYLLQPAARLLYVGVISLSFEAIDMSKEFKPYAIGLFLQVLVPLLVFRWLHSKREPDLVVACAVATGGLFFCQDVMFLYPGLFLVVLIDAWRGQRRRQLVVGLIAATLTLSVTVGMYVLVWSRIEKQQAEQHWGRRYDVFHLATSEKSYPAWFAGKYDDVTLMPGDRRAFWDSSQLGAAKGPVKGTTVWLWRALHFAGLAVMLWRRRLNEALLYWSPLLVCGLFNLLGFWPFGAFRTDHFLLGGVTAIAAFGVDVAPLRPRILAVVPVLLLIVAPLVFLEKNWHANKKVTYRSGAHALLTELNALERDHPGAHGARQILLDTRSCRPFYYYTRYHPDGIPKWAPFAADWTTTCDPKRYKLQDMVRALPPGTPVWMMLREARKNEPWPADLPVLLRKKSVRQELILTRSPTTPQGDDARAPTDAPNDDDADEGPPQ